MRDSLLGLPITESDWVVVGSTEDEMLERGYRRVGKDFPVFLHPQTHEEYALARTERKKGKGYYGFECHASPDVTLEEDLSRRDLTINAMAETLEGEIIDPFDGRQDLQDKILRHVSPAFVEDPVRILRVARFLARFSPMGFRVAPETLRLMQQIVKEGEVEELVPERVWQEMDRALKEAAPTQFFECLRSCHALKILWPSLDKLWGVPQKAEYHPEIDTGVHTMMALDMACRLTEDPITRFAALCHDLGKGETPPEEWPSHKMHEERGVSLIQAFCKHYRVPHDYRDLAILVSRYHLHLHKLEELKPGTVLELLESVDVFRKPKRFDQFLLACEADARGRKGKEEIPYLQSNILRKAVEAALSVDVQLIIKDGVEGEALRDKIRQRRILAIKKALGFD